MTASARSHREMSALLMDDVDIGPEASGERRAGVTRAKSENIRPL